MIIELRKCVENFNPRSLTGATFALAVALLMLFYFNPRSLTGATEMDRLKAAEIRISIHAPLRERPTVIRSTGASGYFNPRSLTGAT